MTPLVASICLGFAQESAPRVTAAELISKAFARYASADRIVGDIRLTQVAQNRSVNVDTQIQLEKPAKVFLFQRRGGSEPRERLVTSDGRTFSYDKPDKSLGRPRYTEDIHIFFANKPKDLTIGDIYLAGVTREWADKGAMLDVIVARSEATEKGKIYPDLQYRLSQWPAFQLQGKVRIGNVDAWGISGSYRDDESKPVTGSFELYITDTGDIVRYVLRQQMEFPNITKDIINVVSTWDIHVIVNGTTNAALFRVVN